MTKNNEPEHGSLVSRSSIDSRFSNLKRMLTLLVNIKANCMTVRL